jgi:citrate synthase
MRATFFRLALVGAMSAVAPLAHAQLLTHRDLSYSMAKTFAETAIDSCAAKGYAVSAVVVDRAGDVIVAIRADNAGPHTMENARRKAYTARSFRTSTTAYAKRFADNDPVVRQQVTALLIIQADHEQNASTTAMRLVGSTRANPYACTAAAIAAL